LLDDPSRIALDLYEPSWKSSIGMRILQIQAVNQQYQTGKVDIRDYHRTLYKGLYRWIGLHQHE